MSSFFIYVTLFYVGYTSDELKIKQIYANAEALHDVLINHVNAWNYVAPKCEKYVNDTDSNTTLSPDVSIPHIAELDIKTKKRTREKANTGITMQTNPTNKPRKGITPLQQTALVFELIIIIILVIVLTFLCCKSGKNSGDTRNASVVMSRNSVAGSKQGSISKPKRNSAKNKPKNTDTSKDLPFDTESSQTGSVNATK
mmetsp:Transcript_57420/g.70174  ORF Transcript_57420/g.70174 Transcript_57420/m.70174 type:complete len:199 (-) Transcript_57420:60-656(-)